ncbi:MAG: tetratricopeptide repeat protein [Bacteroidetes bacterium]|nr:tetratricopeptide repeat protein [Bacteroidota bacterium]
MIRFLPITYIINLAVITFLSFSSFAQTASRIDTLKALIPQKTDTSLANIYLFLAKDYGFFGKVPDSMEAYSLKALNLSEKLNYQQGIERAYFCLGFVYDWKDEPVKSNEYYLKAYQILEKTGNTRGMAAVLNNIGKNYMEWENYPKALEYFLQSISLEENIEDGKPIEPGYNNVATILYYQGNFEGAMQYRRKALKTALASGDKIALVQVFSNLSSDYMRKDQSDSAFFYGRKALNLSREIQFPEGIIRTANQMANLTMKYNKLDSTLGYLDESLATANPRYHLGLIGYSTLLRSDYYQKINQQDSAIFLAEKGLEMALSQPEANRITTAYEHLSEVHTHFGNFQEALKYMTRFHHLKDSLHTLAKNRQIVEMQAQYEADKKEKQIKALAEENQYQELQLRQRNIALIAAIIVAILSFALLMLYFRQKILMEKQQTLEARQRFLLTQMNPHFFFHALSSIQNFIYQQTDPRITGAYLSKFAKLMRLVLENSRETYIPLEKEIDTLKFYLDLQQIRYGNGFEYEIKADPNLEIELLMIPPMFAQPFIENSLEHGLANQDQKGLIRISFSEENGMLKFSVEDNGVGIAPKSTETIQPKRKSLATEITRDRLQLLSNKIKKQVALQIINLKDENPSLSGTRVSFSLPLIYETGPD